MMIEIFVHLFCFLLFKTLNLFGKTNHALPDFAQSKKAQNRNSHQDLLSQGDGGVGTQQQQPGVFVGPEKVTNNTG